jgi:hypothetical protein
MGINEMLTKFQFSKLQGKRPLGIHASTWAAKIKMDFKEIRYEKEYWIQSGEDRRWWGHNNESSVLVNGGKFHDELTRSQAN